jgi:uncharacterized membrane protein
MATSTLAASSVPDVLSETPRISTIDMMRCIVMVIMALDHTRDFFHDDALLFSPTDLERTNPALFFTRIITHFCAPTFVFLSGTSIQLSTFRKSKKELSIFLLTRGLWLILLEVTVIRFSFFFQLYYDVTFFQVIWAIGISMVLLSTLIHLPFKLIVGLGVVITFGHDALHAIQLQPGDPYLLLWSFIHQVNAVEISACRLFIIPYPFLPWLAIMLLGYGLGAWYRKDIDSKKRKKSLLIIGVGATVAFIILRYFNIYGDPAPWMMQKDLTYSFMSFVNVTKYPPSLMYTLMTLGPVLILLSIMENWKGAAIKPFVVFGRVPLFYYILHFYLIHASALAMNMIMTGKTLHQIDFHFNKSFGGIIAGEGVSLGGVYLVWISIVLILYPVCKRYNDYKSTHKHWWLSYL